MRDRRDAEATRFDDPLLRAHERERAERRVDRSRSERAGELAEAEREEGVEVDVIAHVVLVRCDILSVGGCPDPDAVELRDLLRPSSG